MMSILTRVAAKSSKTSQQEEIVMNRIGEYYATIRHKISIRSPDRSHLSM